MCNFMVLCNNLCLLKNYNGCNKKIFSDKEKWNNMLSFKKGYKNCSDSSFIGNNIYVDNSKRKNLHNRKANFINFAGISKRNRSEQGKGRSSFLVNDNLFYSHIIYKLVQKKNKKDQNYISNDFFYHLNKFHLHFVNNYFNEFYLRFTKTSKIFFVVLFSLSIFLTCFLITSSNYLEYNIILKYHIKFLSLLFSFFSSYYLGLQVTNYYFTNNAYYLYTFYFLVSSIFSIFMADYDIWASYYFLNLNFLFFLAINYYNMFLNRLPSYLFKNVNRVIYFSLLSSYLAVNKGKYIENNIEILRDENVDISFFKLFKIIPYIF
ncbi:hypothetical protein MKS88_003718 [Plasmodium brasilianum]|nr:hypothetical protein MKS88_003718 [Plasmodium brasilianum]